MFVSSILKSYVAGIFVYDNYLNITIIDPKSNNEEIYNELIESFKSIESEMERIVTQLEKSARIYFINSTLYSE